MCFHAAAGLLAFTWLELVSPSRAATSTLLAWFGMYGAVQMLGAIVYGFRRPDPWPRWFGFHEIFHTFTILAFVSHYVGISLATYALR